MPTPRPAVAPGERAAEPVDELELEEVKLGLVIIVLVVVTKDCDKLSTVPTVVIVVINVPTTAVRSYDGDLGNRISCNIDIELVNGGVATFVN